MKKTVMSLAIATLLSLSAPIFAEKSPSRMKVNVNNATVQELDEGLEGVGRRIAEEIVKHRNTHGSFQSMDDLDKVKYVGSKLIEKNKSKIEFD
jgi:competence protein ComEA